MHLTIPRRVLLPALKSIAKCVAKVGVPITRHALAIATPGALGGTLTLAATDLAAITATLAVPCDVRAAGACALDPALWLPTVETLPEGDLDLVRAPNGTVTIKTARAKRTLPTSDAADFPAVVHAEGSARQVPVAALRTLAQRVAHAMGADETRPHLAALYLTVDRCELIGAPRPGLVAVATDGHRMAVCHVATGSTGASGEGLPDLFDRSTRRASPSSASNKSGAVLIPRTAWALLEGPLAALPGDAFVTLTVDAMVRAGEPGARELASIGLGPARNGVPSDLYTTKLVDAPFPSWEQVVPREWSATVTAKRAELLAAAEGALAITRGTRDGAVALDFTRPGALVVCAEDPERGTAENELDMSCEGRPPARIGVKGEYLARALKAYDGETIALGLSGELDPIVIYDPGEASSTSTSRQVVMPMRV